MVVRMRRNRSQAAQRRSHHAINGMRLASCDCGALRVSHRACPTCGKYNGRVVIDMVGRAKRDQKRNARRQKELRESGQVTEAKDTEKTKT